MARFARVVAPGFPHHVTQRGNRRQETFFGEDDYQAYVDLLGEWCRAYGVRVWAWCLMPNHVHLIVVPPDAESLRLAVGKTHKHYARRVNFREGWRGHLWQGRFASYPMDRPHLYRAARYIDLNPVRAGLVRRPERWAWSSARGRILGVEDPLVDRRNPLERTRETSDWAAFLQAGLAEDELERLRRHERTGRPLGSPGFVEKVGALVGRDLSPKKPGRKPRQQGI